MKTIPQRIQILKDLDNKDNTESRQSFLQYLGYTYRLPIEICLSIVEHADKFFKVK